VSVAGVGPFGFSWYFDNTNLLQSGPNSALTVTGVSTNNAGNYVVVVTNPWGSVTSQIATLTVAFPPLVTPPPGGKTVLAGSNATLGVTVNGIGPFTYQWQFNGVNLPNNIITTVAGSGPYGNGTGGYSGDGGAATNAGLQSPRGLTFDAAGNLYIADILNNRIRKVDTNGVITTVAGNGGGTSYGGYSGDGGQAIAAELGWPTGIVFDSVGSLYIADHMNHRIRKVDTNGIITTVAGSQNASYAGEGGAATNASLDTTGVSFDANGNLLIADNWNNRILKVDTNGIITTVAGAGNFYFVDRVAAITSGLKSANGVAVDAAGNIYIADSGDRRIRKVDTNGVITTVAGNGTNGYSGDGGAATSASLNNPWGVAVDAAGNL
jgi:sugar lactone lactonase YvrE